MKHKYLILLEHCTCSTKVQHLVESPVALTDAQKHMVARILANQTIEGLQLTPIAKELQCEDNKVFYTTSTNDHTFDKNKFYRIESIREFDDDEIRFLFENQKRPETTLFHPLKTLYVELEMLPRDEQDEENEESRLRLWFKDTIQTDETDGTSLTFTYDENGVHIPLEYREFFTDELNQFIENFIQGGHRDEDSIRFYGEA